MRIQRGAASLAAVGISGVIGFAAAQSNVTCNVGEEAVCTCETAADLAAFLLPESGCVTVECSSVSIEERNLDLDGHPCLAGMNLDDNVFKFIRVKNMPALVDASFNNVSALILDVVNCTKLERLSIRENEFDGNDNLRLEALPALDSLDVSRANNLRFMPIKARDAPNLRSLDVSNTKLRSFSMTELPSLQILRIGSGIFGQIRLDGCQLKELIITSSFAFEGQGFSAAKCPDLEVLQFGRSGLVSIDLDNNPRLRKLTYESNPITEIDLSKVPLLTHLDLGNTRITSLDLQGLTKLEEVDLAFSTVTGALNLTDNAALRVLNILSAKRLTDVIGIETLRNLTDFEADGVTFSRDICPHPDTGLECIKGPGPDSGESAASPSLVPSLTELVAMCLAALVIISA